MIFLLRKVNFVQKLKIRKVKRRTKIKLIMWKLNAKVYLLHVDQLINIKNNISEKRKPLKDKVFKKIKFEKHK